jgi:hypothetical protein
MAATTERPIIDLEEQRHTPGVVERARARWSGMAGRLGLTFCILGFLVIALAWNGAADLDYAQGQLPYLLSGGFGGLGLVVVGAAFIISESHRRDRAVLEQKLEQLIARAAPGAAGNGSASSVSRDTVVVGRSSYHLADCHLVEGRDDAEHLSRQAAEARGLARCRICQP